MDCTAGEEPCRESESSILDSCSGERYYFCLPREQTYSLLLLRGKLSVFQGYFLIKYPWKSRTKDSWYLACKAFRDVKALWRIVFQQLLWGDVFSWEALTAMLLYFPENVIICMKFCNDNIFKCWFKKIPASNNSSVPCTAVRISYMFLEMVLCSRYSGALETDKSKLYC